jgi:hypothetical protein
MRTIILLSTSLLVTTSLVAADSPITISDSSTGPLTGPKKGSPKTAKGYTVVIKHPAMFKDNSGVLQIMDSGYYAACLDVSGAPKIPLASATRWRVRFDDGIEARSSDNQEVDIDLMNKVHNPVTQVSGNWQASIPNESFSSVKINVTTGSQTQKYKFTVDPSSGAPVKVHYCTKSDCSDVMPNPCM